ncbi:hypothetical protein [Streptosporangium sp. NPDC023615]|uniref:hypothetical protein n=1 Tax=Streptosporangium sp. NPDC023615 TaxID=3154794 RepID=UPI0034474988
MILQVGTLQHGLEAGDLVGLGVHVGLREHQAAAMVQGGRQMHRLIIAVACTARCPAVDGPTRTSRAVREAAGGGDGHRCVLGQLAKGGTDRRRRQDGHGPP